ncbi:hypothetical protein B7P43_G18098 [Cryptotermes secundus]|uniref:Uncharacterized protein n=1 Tax=Cryptotermes secundus TaxID=105785 RepID=A0A2J7R009_9NEOP|nr:hypothetical protein B7P43_G18098 [Cryptotermes secundus]
MSSKNLCLLCDKPFYGKQKCIRCCVCELRFHCNYLKTNISECDVDTATSKSSFTCDNCVIGKEQSLVKYNTNMISSGMECSASPAEDNGSLSRQLEAVRLNGECTMQMEKSLMDMVTKFRCEVQVLKSDNTALKLQLRDLCQFHKPPLSTSTEALSSTRDAATKTYRDVLTSGGGHPDSTAASSGPSWQTSIPESSAMPSDNQAANGFITVQRNRKEDNPSSIPSGVPNPPRRTRNPLFGNKRGSSLSTVPKRVRTKARLNPDQIYSAEMSAMSRPPSPPTAVPTPDRTSGSVSPQGATVEGIDKLE